MKLKLTEWREDGAERYRTLFNFKLDTGEPYEPRLVKAGPNPGPRSGYSWCPNEWFVWSVMGGTWERFSINPCSTIEEAMAEADRVAAEVYEL